MRRHFFPVFVRSLPEADLPLPGLRGWMQRGPSGLTVFLEAETDVDLPVHSHGDQWGTVVAGEIDLTIGDETVTYRAGDSYTIPAGTPHGGRILADFAAVDYFTDPDRYREKTGERGQG
jgi:quercetin dioxygenase-like cupin family protein